MIRILLFAAALLAWPSLAQAQTPYDECVEGSLSGAVQGDQPRLRAEQACLLKAAINYLNGSKRRGERADELDAAATIEPVPDPEPPVHDHPEPPETEPEFYPKTPIASNFDRSAYLLTKSIPESAAPDVVGAFRFICQPSHLNYDDAIVYPGMEGASHLHQYFGNTRVKFNTTYEDLRTTGDSTCMNPLNRSGYWIPAMLDGHGSVVRPDHIKIYYKRRPADDPECYGNCVPQPDGIKVIFGYDMMGGPTTGNPWVLCNNRRYNAGEALPKDCGPKVHLLVNTLPCWDGKHLDTPDHRSHYADMEFGAHTGWKKKCPLTHPKQVPVYTASVSYTTDANFPDWRLSSDEMAGVGQFASFHTDLWDGWDRRTKDVWTEYCINLLLNCSDGDTGNGQIMKRWAGFSYKAEPRLVPIPQRPHHH